MFLFLLGLLTGLVEPQFTNVRMGLAAHLEGVMNGIFLVALGAVWQEVHLSPKSSTIAFWTAIYGTYANWAVTTLAAILGTSALSPISAAGHAALPWQEGLVTFGFISVAISIVAATLIILVQKSDRILQLRSGETFGDGVSGRARLGAHPTGYKRHEGDKRTPEGHYTVDYRKTDSDFHLALHISYPTSRIARPPRPRGSIPEGRS
jgi:hydroxylaminobenzene mutase